MGRPFMGNRVAAVVVCGLLVGVIGAALAAASAIQHAAGAPSTAQNGSTAQRASSDATSTSSSSSSSSATPTSSSSSSSSSATATPSSSSSPTPLPSPTATRVPGPAPTATPPPGTKELQGNVTSVNQSNGTFVLQTSSSAVTVDTNGAQFTGQSSSLSGLQGCSVNVYGSYQGANFVAVQVNATDC